jgi:hypothetical protein
MEKVKKTLDLYYTVKTTIPELMSNMEVTKRGERIIYNGGMRD